MAQKQNIQKNGLKKQCEGFKAGAWCSLAEQTPSLLVPDLGRLTCTLSGSPSPPTASNSNVVDPSSVNNTSPGAPPVDTGKKGHVQETKEEMFPSPCEYGEPMRPQHLVLDFSPKEGDDDEYKVKKVLDFWKFIRSVPGLDILRASPEDWGENSENVVDEESENDGSENLTPETIPFAKSAIPWIKRSHMMCTAFTVKQKGKYCEQGGGDYFVPQPHKITKKTAAKPNTSHSSSERHSGGSGSAGSSTAQASASQVDVHTLCKQLDEWDQINPSTLEPPATPPKRGYNTAVLQPKHIF